MRWPEHQPLGLGGEERAVTNLHDEITAAIDDHLYAVSGHGEIWVEGIEDAARAVLELMHGESDDREES